MFNEDGILDGDVSSEYVHEDDNDRFYPDDYDDSCESDWDDDDCDEEVFEDHFIDGIDEE